MRDNSTYYKNIGLQRLPKEYQTFLVKGLSKLGYGVFVWDYTKNVCFVNDYMINKYSIKIDTVDSLIDYLSSVIDEQPLFRFLKNIYQIRVDGKNRKMRFSLSINQGIKNKVELVYDEEKDISIGVMKSISSGVYKKPEKEVHSVDIMERLLSEIGIPLCLYKLDSGFEYSNFQLKDMTKSIYQIIEKLNIGTVIDFLNYKDIMSVEEIDTNINEKMYSVRTLLDNEIKEEIISRSIISVDNVKYVMYKHKVSKNDSKEQNRLFKILRTNELMMEIRDIVDNVDNLKDMFEYLLSKIHTVIPKADRCCILSADQNNNLYVDTAYGFNDRFINNFKIPFNKSFAYIHLENNYSRSVIINDIQKKYGNLFPDISDDDTRYRIESNLTSPLVIDNDLYGIISVDSDENKVFDDIDLNLLDYMKVQIERAIIKFREISIIKKDSTEDSLTGVANRRELLKVLDTFKENATFEDKSFHFVVFDIDNLKVINDSYGHNYGDMVIKQFANVVQKNTRESDFFARIGGDEFVGLFYDIDQLTLIDRITQWTRYLEDNPIKVEASNIITKYSYGISKFPTNGIFFSSLMEVSDKMLYSQKREKKRKLGI